MCFDTDIIRFQIKCVFFMSSSVVVRTPCHAWLSIQRLTPWLWVVGSTVKRRFLYPGNSWLSADIKVKWDLHFISGSLTCTESSWYLLPVMKSLLIYWKYTLHFLLTTAPLLICSQVFENEQQRVPYASFPLENLCLRKQGQQLLKFTAQDSHKVDSAGFCMGVEESNLLACVKFY